MSLLGDDWTMPGLTALNREWFTAAALRIQTCEGCGNLQHPPEEICHSCGGMAFGYTTSAPRGTVYSYTVAQYPVHRALADHVPYAVVLVSLDEYPEIRVIGNVLDVAPEAVHIGMAVTATWQERTNPDGDTIQFLQWVAG